MARPLRIDIPDGVYHVTSRGLERRNIVRDDRDRRKWLSLLARTAVRRDWRVLAWALMDNHFHLFLRTPHGDLSGGMHDLNSGYVTVFNGRHERSGPLFQGRFNQVLVESGYHYWELSRYVHLNPVRAGIVLDPVDYPWSSCRDYFGSRAAPRWLAWEEVLCLHGRTVRAAREEYRRFLAAGIDSSPPSPLAGVVASTLLGSKGFVDQMKLWLQDRLPDRDVPAARELRKHVTMAQIEEAVCQVLAVSAKSLRARGKHGNDARAAALYLCRHLTPVPVRGIGEHFGGIGAAAVCSAVAKVAERRTRDQRLDRHLRRIEATIRE